MKAFERLVQSLLRTPFTARSEKNGSAPCERRLKQLGISDRARQFNCSLGIALGTGGVGPAEPDQSPQDVRNGSVVIRRPALDPRQERVRTRECLVPLPQQIWIDNGRPAVDEAGKAEMSELLCESASLVPNRLGAFNVSVNEVHDGEVVVSPDDVGNRVHLR